MVLALILNLALASPGLAPRLDPGPFQASELVGASLGVLAGDVLVASGGYLTLELFANNTLDPTAANFRKAAYVLGAGALVLPPLTAVLLARFLRVEPATGSAWKAFLLAMVGQTVALAAGYIASPNFWVVLPVQLVAIGLGTSFGLHWGPRARKKDASPAVPNDAARAVPTVDARTVPPDDAARHIPGLCLDPAIASAFPGS